MCFKVIIIGDCVLKQREKHCGLINLEAISLH